MMKKFRYVIFLLGVFFISICQVISQDLNDWGVPRDRTFKAKWRSKSPTRYLVCVEDFNGDGKKDTARIMESLKGEGVAIFVFLSDAIRSNVPICIYNSETDSPFAKLNKVLKLKIQTIYRRSYGIKIVKKGRYKTACGKGYFDCKEDEPDEINLQYPGIWFFQYDAGGDRYFYWDINANKFLVQQMND